MSEPVVAAGARPRAPAEIAKRAIAVHLSAARAEGLEAEKTASLATELGVVDVLTPSETLILFAPEPLTPDVAQRFQWRHEACWVFLWTLGHVPELAFPDRTSDPARASAIITAAASASHLAASGPPRDADEVLDEADFTLRLEDVCKSEIASGGLPPDGLLYPVVHQRAAAFRWSLAGAGPQSSGDRFDP